MSSRCMGVPQADKAAPPAQPSGGSKTIGLFGGVMLLTNNLAGPTISLMPLLAQHSGWIPLCSVMASLAVMSGGCGWLLLTAMRRMPGNSDFELRVEFADLTRFYLPPLWDALAMACYFGYLALTLITYVIQTAQVLDYASLDILGCAYGLELWPTPFRGVCGTTADATTPFGEMVVLPCSFLLVGVVCVPLAWKNLDDNILLQWAAIIGLVVLSAIWTAFLVQRPGFPHSAALPAYSTSPGMLQELLGVLLFNFALMAALPSWANEKKPEVSTALSLSLSLGFVVVLYTFIGVVGALAYSDLEHGNLFSKLNISGSPLVRATVIAYPILQNLTSIPVLSIFLKYNFLQLRWLGHASATFASFAGPWLLSVPLYTGGGFEAASEIGGLVCSTAVNFLAPAALYALARGGWLANPAKQEQEQQDTERGTYLIVACDCSSGAGPPERGDGEMPVRAV